VTEPTYAAIARLLFTYAERLDAGDLGGMAALFEKATFRSADGAMVLTGTAEVRAAFAGSVQFHDGTPATQHVTTNLYVDEDPDGRRAVAHSAFTVLQATETLPLQVVCAGRYRDEFVRDDSGWHFADRLVDIRFFGDVSQHIVAASESGAVAVPEDSST
jgi:3-phenylpropionate/cinnamic acid dioxygenase small subunit